MQYISLSNGMAYTMYTYIHRKMVISILFTQNTDHTIETLSGPVDFDLTGVNNEAAHGILTYCINEQRRLRRNV